MTSELWRSLKVGDRVRVRLVPPGCHPETVAVYEQLILTKRPLRICEIDSDGLPWVRFKIGVASHYLALNHDGIELMKK